MPFIFKKFLKDESIQSENATSKPTAYLWIFSVLLLMAYPYFFVLRLQSSGGFLVGLVLYVIPILLCPVLFYKTIASFSRTTKLRIWVPIIAFILFPIYLMFSGKFIIERELISNGVKTIGKITYETYLSQDKQKNEVMRIRFFCEYRTGKAQFKTHVQTVNSDSINFLKNSRTDVIYSKTYPNVFLCGSKAVDLIEQNKIDSNSIGE